MIDSVKFTTIFIKWFYCICLHFNLITIYSKLIIPSRTVITVSMQYKKCYKKTLNLIGSYTILKIIFNWNYNNKKQK